MSTPDVAALLEGEPAHDQVVFATRLQRYWPDLITGLTGAYPDHAPEMAYRWSRSPRRTSASGRPSCGCSICAGTPTRSGSSISRCSATRPTPTGSAATLAGVASKVDYLAELGVTYLHLMPMLKPRPGQSDGGYAVMDYRAVREDLGTIDDLRDLATTLRSRGISLTLDLVLNHVAAEHEWAEGARNGDRFYRNYFYMFADREMPDAYERSLARGVPGLRPGQLHLRRGVLLLGLDHVQHLAVGPQLAQPRCLLRVRRPDPLAGQSRGGVPAPGRDRLHLQADGHQLPEPARGARHHPGPAYGGPDRCPGADLQGRGDRRPGRPRSLPGGRASTRAR